MEVAPNGAPWSIGVATDCHVRTSVRTLSILGAGTSMVLSLQWLGVLPRLVFKRTGPPRSLLEAVNLALFPVPLKVPL